MGERNISLTLAYDGTDFSGWQIQCSQRTVQGVLEDVLKNIHGCRIPVIGAGRTDSGVHARGQVANFVIDIASIPAEKYKEALNSNLPQDLRVIRSREVDRDFNARRSARERIYRYYLYISTVGFPHYRRYCWRISRKPDIQYLNLIAGGLLGEQDFTTFAAARDTSKSMVRAVYGASFYPEGPFLVFEISASSFLWKMVRSIVGTVLEIEQLEHGEERLKEVLAARDRSLAGTTAPARGLFLERILYNEHSKVFE